MIGKYIPANINPDVFNRDGLCHIANTTMTPPCMLRPGGSSSVNLMVFSIGQLLMGAGTTPLYTLGVAYLDENVNPKQSPIYLGVWFASTFLGPGLGYVIGGLFLGQFTNIELVNIFSFDFFTKCLIC